MRFRLANLKMSLGSVSSVCYRGNRVGTDSEGLYVELKSSGKRVPPRTPGGVYGMDAWAGGGQAKLGRASRRQARRP